jgi:hypothetical protein
VRLRCLRRSTRVPEIYRFLKFIFFLRSLQRTAQRTGNFSGPL